MAELTDRQCGDFWNYFNCADEVYESICAKLDQSQSGIGQGLAHEPLTLADLDKSMVKSAQRAAESLNLPWPPYLPDAEEFALAHREELADA